MGFDTAIKATFPNIFYSRCLTLTVLRYSIKIVTFSISAFFSFYFFLPKKPFFPLYVRLWLTAILDIDCQVDLY